MATNRHIVRARDEDSDSEFESGSSDEEIDSEDLEDEEDLDQPTASGSIKRKLPFKDLYTFICRVHGCGFKCRRYKTLDIHVEQYHNCQHCGISYPDLRDHICDRIGQRGGHVGPVNVDQSFFREIDRAHRGIVAEYEYEADDLFTDFPTFFQLLWDPLSLLLKQYLGSFNGITVRLRMETELEEIRTLEKKIRYMGTNNMTLTHENFIDRVLHFGLNFVLAQLELYNANGSGHTVTQIFNVIVTIGEYRPIAARGYIPIPSCLARRKGLLNIKGSDTLCFKYCIAANFFHEEVREYKKRLRTLWKQTTSGSDFNKAAKRAVECGKNYELFFEKFDWDGLEFPVSLEAIETFERSNNISVNCFGNVGKDIIPLRLTTLDAERQVNLLRLEYEDNAHYVLIRDLEAFLGQDGKCKHYYCRFCLKNFAGKNVLLKHKKQCPNIEFNIMEFPKEKYYVFKNFEMTIPFPYCLYYDFECFNKALDVDQSVNTRKTSILEPSGYSLVLVGPDNYLHVDEYHGPDVVNHFLRNALGLADLVLRLIKENQRPMHPTNEELLQHEQAQVCYVCHKPFTAKNYKVLHHNHMTGQVVGSLHNICNLKIKYKHMLPTVCHNATRFDHAIILHGFKSPLVTSVEVIPKTSETFMGFIVNKRLKFLDSCQFLLASLSKLVEDLKKDGIDKFRNTRVHFHNQSDKTIDLLISKQVYPYDYVTGPEVYRETELPAKEFFYDSLRGEDITDEAYTHAQKVWNAFGCQTFEDYARVYSISDSLLLADVFENFRETAFENRGLDPLYSWSSPGFSWNCAMYSSKMELEYVKDLDILNMLQEGIRGGPTLVCDRIATANNEDLGPDWPFDPSKPRKRLVYQDLNSLYPFTMLSPLPYKDFKMMTRREIERVNIDDLTGEDGKGYIFSVDLDYPEHLHNAHDDLPLAVEKRKIRIDEISPTQEHLIELYNKVISKPLGGEKLVMTLYPKENYVVYYKTLQFYLKHGLVLKKIHKGFKFSETYVFRDYIAGNLEARRNTKSELVNSLYKLLSNSLFGRTLMNSKNFFDVTLCSSRVEAQRLLAKANLKSFTIIDDDITLFSMHKIKQKCNSFFYLGFVILELAKLRLYQSYYEGIKTVFGSRSRICYSDTDSFVNIIDDPDNTFIEDMKKLSAWYDFSNLSVDNPLYSTKNKGVPGIFKLVITDGVEIAAISSKMYSVYTIDDIQKEKAVIKARKEKEKLNKDTKDTAHASTSTQNQESMIVDVSEDLPGPSTFPEKDEKKKTKRELMRKGKGIGRSILAKLRHEHYVNTILNQNIIFQVEMKSIRSFKSVLYRVLLKKIGFHALDTKRFILHGGIHTLAFGNYNIERVIREEAQLQDSSETSPLKIQLIKV